MNNDDCDGCVHKIFSENKFKIKNSEPQGTARTLHNIKAKYGKDWEVLEAEIRADERAKCKHEWHGKAIYSLMQIDGIKKEAYAKGKADGRLEGMKDQHTIECKDRNKDEVAAYETGFRKGQQRVMDTCEKWRKVQYKKGQTDLIKRIEHDGYFVKDQMNRRAWLEIHIEDWDAIRKATSVEGFCPSSRPSSAEDVRAEVATQSSCGTTDAAKSPAGDLSVASESLGKGLCDGSVKEQCHKQRPLTYPKPEKPNEIKECKTKGCSAIFLYPDGYCAEHPKPEKPWFCRYTGCLQKTDGGEWCKKHGKK